ncbi:unnamed protein product [Absidia cylindrospora]
MGLSQRLVALIASTIRYTTRATRPTKTYSTTKRQVSTSTRSPQSTPASSLYLDTRNDNDDHEFHPLSTTTILPQETIFIAVIGQSHIDKSSLIHCGFSSTVAQQDIKNTPSVNTDIRQHSIMLNLKNNTSLRHIMFLELDHDLENHDLTTISVHAALICYDVTQRQSIDGVPDLLNYYHSRRLPVSLLGIKSDLTAKRQLDFTLGEQLAYQHSVPFYEMVTDDSLDIQHVFMKLIHQCANSPQDTTTLSTNTDNGSNNSIHTARANSPESFSSCTSSWSTEAPLKTYVNDVDTRNIFGATIEAADIQHPIESNNHYYHHRQHHQVTMTSAPFLSSSRPLIHPISPSSSGSSTSCHGSQSFMGFAYAPTPPTHDSHQVQHEYTPSTSMLSSPRNISINNFSNHRRRSKDSCDFFGPGLNVDDIIDRLVSPELGRADEQMVPIFIIFFRKFMTPFELVQGLIKRFEDHMCMSVLPTPQQQRIALVLTSWMTDYWCDFYHRKTRYQLNLFLGRLSATMNFSEETTTSLSLKHILDTLHNLIIQPVPDYDPDSTWGRKDDDGVVSKTNLDKRDTRANLSYSDAGHLSHTNHSIDLGQHVQYTTLSSPSTQYRHLSLIPSSTLSCTSTSQQSLPMTPEPLSLSTTATCSSPTLKAKAYSFFSLSTLPRFGSNSVSSPVHHENHRRSPICPKQSTNISTQIRNPTAKTVSALPSHTRVNQPEFSGGTIGLDCLFLKSSTPSPIASNEKPTKNHQYTHEQRGQTMQHSSSSSSSYLSIASLRSLTPGIFKTSTPPTPLSFSPRPMTPTPATATLLDRKCRNNNRSGFLHKYILSTSMSPSPNVSFSSSTCTDTSVSSSIHHTSSSIKTNTKIFLSLSKHEMADQLTWIEAELFGKIKSREFLRLIWANHDIKSVQQKQQQEQISTTTSEGMDQQSDNGDTMMAKSGLQASISHFNYISAWVISMVVTQPKLAKRVALLEKFMMIAVALRNQNNYNTLMAILAGINNAAILRLKQTQEIIKKKKIYKRFQSLEKLMSSDRSYCSYRLALKASTTCPSIPYLGIHSQDLIALAEANKDVKTDGTVHWEKFRLMGECIMMIMKLQNPKHKVEPDQMILTWLADFSILTEEEQYQQSMQIEPRLKTTSMNHLRGLWSNI